MSSTPARSRGVLRRHTDRYRQIAEVLGRHGLGYLAGVAGLRRWVPFTRLGPDRGEPRSAPVHLRLALEQLGPTFIKLGQVLSTRPDLLGEDYRAELAALQDAAPSIPGDLVADEIERELGISPYEAFAAFDSEPVASASIGQAHAAVLHDGTEVIVKVRRPGVREQVEQDLEILANLAVRAGQVWEAAAHYDLPGVVAEFAATLRAELDYLTEGQNAERFADNFVGDARIHIPRVFWDTTTSRVLTLERVRGVKIDDSPGLDAAGVDRRELATVATGALAQMIFTDGFFHADPHPGNLFVEPGGRIGLIDFGMVGEVDEELRQELAVLLIGLTGGSPERVAAALADLSVGRGPVDRTRLAADLGPVVALYRGRPLDQIPLGKLIRSILGVVGRHRLQLPREAALLFKTVIMAEGAGVLLDPDFQLAPVLGPFARRLAAERYSARALARGLPQFGADAAELVGQLPELLARFRGMLDSGGPEVHLRAAELEVLVNRLEALGRRAAAATVAAALIRTLGRVATTRNPDLPPWQRTAAGVGLGAASALGVGLAWSVGQRPRRRRR